jgi:phosphomannomutase
MPIVSSISGLRATLGDSLKPELIINYCSALGSLFQGETIVVGRDGRQSGIWIESIVAGTLSACGCKVVLLGIVPTPTVQVAIDKYDAAAGIAITASHNPSEWNGLKFINQKGIFFDLEENQELWDTIKRNDFIFTKETKFKEIFHDDTLIDYHIFRVLNVDFIQHNIDKIKERKFKVVVDAVNASGSKIVPDLLRYLDCDVVKLYCNSSGIFPHLPEPLPQNLTKLAESVKQQKADLGIAVDPDADRLVLIDNLGRNIGEEKTITLAVESVLMNAPNSNVVVNYSTTALVDYVANKYLSVVHRAPVGEINVVNKMIKVNAIIGGEGSGGVILPECHYGRDSLVGIGLVLSLLAETGKSLSEMADSYPDYKMIKTKHEFHGDLKPAIEILKEQFKEANVIVEDGIRIDFENAWVQLRASNTEPIIRIIGESESNARTQELIDRITKMINS